MSKHRYEKCCMPMYGYGPMAAYGGGYGATGYTAGAWQLKWFYALLLLIVIVLQFGRNFKRCDGAAANVYGDEGAVVEGCYGNTNVKCNNDQLIDNSVLFIIIVFLLVLCAGCWWDGYGGGSGF